MFYEHLKNEKAIQQASASVPPKAMCMDCHRDYNDFGLDTVMPDEQWALINPDINGLLCAQCIVNRASKLDGVIVMGMNLITTKGYDIKIIDK